MQPTLIATKEHHLARFIANQLLPSNPKGGTYDPRTSSLPVFNDERTYLVSVQGHECRVVGSPSARQLVGWLKRVRTLLAKKHHYLGWWRDGAELVFDISLALNGGRTFILDVAKSWRQGAVYHPASEQVLYVASESQQAA